MAKAFYALTLSVLIFCVGCGSKSGSLNPASSPTPAAVNSPALSTVSGSPSLAVNSPANGFTYAYGPSIIQTQGEWHAYFCSTGTSDVNNWDVIRHSTSSDLVNWSAPVQVTGMSPSNYERSNCDPSVVFNSEDGYYYMFYGGCVIGQQTVIFEARSQSPDGPFLKWTQRGTWELNPSDSQIVIAPINPTTDTSYYGAGQPSVVIRDGVWYMWYSDDTANGTPMNFRTYLSESFDGVNWSSPTLTAGFSGVGNNSVDVKWDAANSQWVMIEIVNQFANSSLVMQTSTDGINWNAPTMLQAAGSFPAGASNPGVSSDDQGNLISGQTLIAYGAPYAPATVNPTTGMAGTWGNWNLFGSMTTSGSSGAK
jgi:hypothetical protein